MFNLLVLSFKICLEAKSKDQSMFVFWSKYDKRRLVKNVKKEHTG